MAKTNIKSKKIIVLILMMLALATIYVLPYLRYTFYIPLQEAMNLVGENKKIRYAYLYVWHCKLPAVHSRRLDG